MYIQELLNELRSLCDDTNIIFSLYNDIPGKKYIFRFDKCDKATKISISYIDLEYKGKTIIMAEINRAILTLYDDIRNNK